MMPMPKRDIGLCFLLDTNRINARQLDKSMNQFEEWAENEVIFIYWPRPAAIEVMKGGSFKRFQKLLRFGPKMEVLAKTGDEQAFLQRISDILFGRSPKNENELRDIEIVFVAKKYAGSLITEDGASKAQPNGILGKRSQLKSELGIEVYRTDEAVSFVRRRINLRDEKAKAVAARASDPLPDWVEKD